MQDEMGRPMRLYDLEQEFETILLGQINTLLVYI
jgi:hypothetical protein